MFGIFKNVGYNIYMNKKIPTAYKIISFVVLALCGYAFLLPVISPLLEKIIPSIWMCPFLRITGSECPFCGITRGVSEIYKLEFSGASIMALASFLIIGIETAFRIMVVLLIDGLKIKTIKAIVVTDIICHTVLIVFLAVYAIMFLINNF